VPEIDPVLELKTKPVGKVGEIEYPFVFTLPPEFDALTGEIGFPSVTDWTELESEITGAISAATTVSVKVAVDVPPVPEAVTMYVRCDWDWMGVPEIDPVLVLKFKPDGRDGDTE